VIAPAPRLRRDPPAPRDVIRELAEILATAYLRLRFPANATGDVREKEASASATPARSERQPLSTPPGSPSCEHPADRPPGRSTS
jgi:hypothetical protein